MGLRSSQERRGRRDPFGHLWTRGRFDGLGDPVFGQKPVVFVFFAAENDLSILKLKYLYNTKK